MGGDRWWRSLSAHHLSRVAAALRTLAGDGRVIKERVVGRLEVEQQSMTAVAMAFILILRCPAVCTPSAAGCVLPATQLLLFGR